MWLDLILFAKAFGPSNPTHPAHLSYPAQPTPLTAPDFPEWDGSWTVALGRTGQRRKWLPCPWNQSRPLPTQTMAISHPSTHPANFNLPPHHPQTPPHTVCLPPPPSTGSPTPHHHLSFFFPEPFESSLSSFSKSPSTLGQERGRNISGRDG